MAIAMAAAGLDVCMIEESWKFPTPSWPVWTYTLVNKLRADKMCKGCSPPPHRFFRGNEGHPRPRCFNIHEVKPHPSLWETMTGLWRGKGKKSLINAAIYLETHE